MITLGIDEVGRGCWAGPLVASAVILYEPIAGLRDSKKLSKSQREKLAAQISVEAAAVGLGWVEPAEIDKIGLTKSVGLAMRRALDSVLTTLADGMEAIDEIIIDGNINYFPDITSARAVIKADDLVPAVSAASIVAKVARDRYMADVAHAKYPVYGFDKHVGYGTAAHSAALAQHGVTNLHRTSYKPIQKFVLHSNE